MARCFNASLKNGPISNKSGKWNCGEAVGWRQRGVQKRSAGSQGFQRRSHSFRRFIWWHCASPAVPQASHATAEPSIAKVSKAIAKGKPGERARRQEPSVSQTKLPSPKPRKHEQSLPRTRELKCLAKLGAGGCVIGVDEAGRGPLAGSSINVRLPPDRWVCILCNGHRTGRGCCVHRPA